jgi:hypothetical protein
MTTNLFKLNIVIAFFLSFIIYSCNTKPKEEISLEKELEREEDTKITIVII